MAWILMALGAVAVVVLGLVVVGRETFRLRTTARPAVFDIEEAVDWIAERLPERAAATLSHDDVRWILQTDVDLLEEATDEPDRDGVEVVDEDLAVARILARAEDEAREVSDEHVVDVLAARSDYLTAIGAIGPLVTGPDDIGA